MKIKSLIVVLFSLMICKGFLSLGQSAHALQDGEFLFAGYSLQWRTGKTFIIDTQEGLQPLLHELEASEYVQYLPDLLPEPGRPDFNPVVDFSQEVVVVVVGQRHESPCRKTNVIGVERSQGNDLRVDLEEIFSTPCNGTASPSLANPVILLKTQRPVAGVSVISTVKEVRGE